MDSKGASSVERYKGGREREREERKKEREAEKAGGERGGRGRWGGRVKGREGEGARAHRCNSVAGHGNSTNSTPTPPTRPRCVCEGGGLAFQERNVREHEGLLALATIGFLDNPALDLGLIIVDA